MILREKALHLNIRSINKNFKNFKNFLTGLKYNFSIICFSETWLNDLDSWNQEYELPNYISIHQIWNHSWGDEVSIYIDQNFSFKIRHDLTINCKDVESLSVEFITNLVRNTLFDVLYRPPNGHIDPFESFVKDIFNKKKIPTICINWRATLTLIF